MVDQQEGDPSNDTAVSSLLGKDFKFNDRLLFNVVGYALMFVMGTIGNTIVFIFSYRQHKSPENNGRTNVHMMVLHLTVADLIVSFVVIPLEIGWRLSVQWYAGNVACKILMFVRAFAFYLSSMTLVSMSIDRCLAISKPLASLKRSGNSVGIKRRGRIMITIAWIASTLFALPQTFVFRVLRHPEVEFYQCTTMGYFDHMFNNSTAIITPPQAEKLYNSLFLVAVYMVPLLVIVITYAKILHNIFRKSRRSSTPVLADDEESPTPRLRWRTSRPLSNAVNSSNVSQQIQNTQKLQQFLANGNGNGHLTNSTSGSGDCNNDKDKDNNHGGLLANNHNLKVDTEIAVRSNSVCQQLSNSSNGGLKSNASVILRSTRGRSQNVALRMSLMHVMAFVACWTPYLVISLWHILDDASAKKVKPIVQDALFLTAVLNSCINPFVYGGFYFRKLRASRRQTSFSLTPRMENSTRSATTVRSGRYL